MFRGISRPEPNKPPPTPLPFYVRSVGYFEVDKGWAERHPAKDKDFVQFFWCTVGEGEFYIGDTCHILRRNDVMFHLPGEDHVHCSLTQPWSYHWFTLDGPMAADYIRGYQFPRHPLPAGQCPVDLFVQLENYMCEMSPYSHRKMVSIAADILALAGSKHNVESTHDRLIKRFVEHVQEHYHDPNLNVNELADRLEIHRTTLTRIFKEKMLISPGEYLMKLRLQRAMSLLRETDFPIHEVGEMVGIPNRGYFCRQIRRMTGVSPTTYRERLFMI